MLWEREAEKYGADLERVQVWDALSEFYLLSEFGMRRIALYIALPEWLPASVLGSPTSDAPAISLEVLS